MPISTHLQKKGPNLVTFSFYGPQKLISAKKDMALKENAILLWILLSI
jgi:hypothetical protein